MPFTDQEKDVVAEVLHTAIANAMSQLNGFRLIADFADLTKAQQMDFVKTRVQMRRDRVAAAIAAHTANAAAQLVELNSNLAILDGLLGKL